MATRSGSGSRPFDASDDADIDDILQKESGLKGLSGLSGDMRPPTLNGHSGAIQALDVFRHRLIQSLGAMAASLRGVDVLALSSTTGKHAAGPALVGRRRRAS